MNSDSPDPLKTFAAQTLKAKVLKFLILGRSGWHILMAIKVVYDLNQLSAAQLPLLRDTLVSALQRFSGGPRNILVQICLAISGLAMQMNEWAPMAVQNLIDTLGTVPASVPGLLQFLAVLPDDVNTNTRIPISVSLPGSPLDHPRLNSNLVRTMSLELVRSGS
jgi:hypothetical protein